MEKNLFLSPCWPFEKPVHDLSVLSLLAACKHEEAQQDERTAILFLILFRISTSK